MNELLQKAKSQLQAGDIRTISKNAKIPYQTVYHVIKNGKTSRKQNEIIKAVADFLQERKTELERLENLLK